MKTRFLLIGVSIVIGLLGAGAGLRLAALAGERHTARLDAAAQAPLAANPTRNSTTDSSVAAPALKARARQTLLSLPLQFVANAGQTDAGVDFTVRSLGGALFFTPDAVVFSLPGADDGQGQSVVRLRLLGANPDAAPEGEARLAGVANFFLGNDPAQWRSNVPTYGAVAYREVYPGIDLVFRGTEGQLKTEFLLAPGADPTLIQMAYSGVTDAHVRDDGALVLDTPGGELIDEAPIAYQEIEGHRSPVSTQFRLPTSDLQPPTIGFILGDYDPAYPLVIDPVLAFSTYLGGSGNEYGTAIAVDGAGTIYVAGETRSTDFPTRNATQSTYGGGSTDVFVTQILKMEGVYTYGFSTYLGGNGYEHGAGITIDDGGKIYVTGHTDSTNFPTRNAISGTLSGSFDVFVTQIISASGIYTLGYSTFLGGDSAEYSHGIALGITGNVYVTGYTLSSNFPIKNAISNTLSGIQDAFVTQIITTGGVITYGYSTYLGGSNNDAGHDIAVDSAGNAYVTGWTYSANFPTWNAISSRLSGPEDAFVTKIVSTSGVITYGYSTYLGGSFYDGSDAVAVDGEGNVYVACTTNSIDFPMQNAIRSTYGGGFDDVAVTQIISAGGVITYGYSTYLGGSGFEQGFGIAVDSMGNVYVTGVTTSTDFPTWKAVSGTYGGGIYDSFVTQIISTNGVITYGYSTFLGGSGGELGFGVAADGMGNAYVTGLTDSGNFLTTQNAISTTLSGLQDAFVTVIAPIAADLSISKSDGVTSTAPGALITYTIVVTNSGPDAVSGVAVTDTFPAAITGVVWSCEASVGSSCGAPGGSGPPGISTTVNLSATGTITFTASGTVASDATGALTNTAYVAHPADSNIANNSATDSDAIVWKVYLPLIMK